MKAVKYLLFWLIQFSWGFIQSLIGFCVALSFRLRFKCETRIYRGAIVTYVHGSTGWGGVSLGAFISVNGDRPAEKMPATVVHEFGHCIQSLLLGPLYMAAVGIPSMIWCNAKRFRKLRQETGKSYYSIWPENNANYFGAKITGEAVPND